MSHRKSIHVYFWIIFAICLIIFAVRGSPAIADVGGSSVTFAPGAGGIGATCYIPNEYSQKLCFSLDSTTTDGEDTSAVYMKFPNDWDVGQLGVQVISQSCTNGGSVSGLWQSDGPYGREVDDGRVQNSPDHCTGVYCWNVSTGATNTETVSIPWIWFGQNEGAGPHHPCSNDDYYLGFPVLGCDEHDSTPPASVPICEFVPITILPETLPNALAGHFYTQQLSPINQDPYNNPDYFYSSSGGMPADFSLFSNTGGIEWDSPQVGSYTFTAYVEGPGWSEGSREYTIVVDPELIFTPNLLASARQNVAYDQPITVSGGTAPYTLSLDSGTLPTGINFTNDAFTGTPTEAGLFENLVVRAIDAAGVDQTFTYSLMVYPEHLFTWTPTNPASGQQATFVSIPDINFYTWSYGYDPDGDCTNTLWENEQQKTIAFYGKGDHKVCLTLTDYDPTYIVLYDEQWVTVTNGAPYIQYSWNFPNPSFPGSPVEAEVGFYDYDGPGSFTCEIDWGDGSTDTTYPGNGNWECGFPPHVYEAVGQYQIEVTVTDDEGASAEGMMSQTVVYVYAEGNFLKLASNSLPTSITLFGMAPLGTESLQFNISTTPNHGSLSELSFIGCTSEVYMPGMMVCRATVLFTPTIETPLYVGSDNFEFTVSDDDGHTSDPAMINLWLDENEPPTAHDGSAVVHNSEPSLISIYGSDMDVYEYTLDDLTFIIDTPPQYGTLQAQRDPFVHEYYYDGNWNMIGAYWGQSLTYTPFPGTIATSDTFTFHTNDTHQDSDTATMTLTLHTPTSLHVNVNDDIVDVDGCNDTHCSLREAVADAQVGDTIDFTLALPNTITLTWAGGGELLINKNIHIQGPGADQLSISAGFTDPEMNPEDGFRVFHIYNNDDPMDASISGVTIRDGRASEGGGVYVDEDASLTISDCVIGPNNIVSYAGGGISANEADVAMTNCSVVENHGTGTVGGAGIFIDDSIMTITNSTISGNVTNNFGGGILAYDDTTLTLVNVTVSGNLANQNYETEAWGGGGGVYIDRAEVYLKNSIVAGNTDLTEPSEHVKWPDVKGSFVSLGGNLIGDETGSTGWLPSDLVGNSGMPVDPMLGSLDVHEPGNTPTFPLLEGSPAIDFATCAAGVGTDQRGIKRPQGITCDSGAFELENSLTYLFIPLILR